MTRVRVRRDGKLVVRTSTHLWIFERGLRDHIAFLRKGLTPPWGQQHEPENDWFKPGEELTLKYQSNDYDKRTASKLFELLRRAGADQTYYVKYFDGTVIEVWRF